MRESTSTGCTTSSVPKPRAMVCRKYPSRAVPVPAHQRGRLMTVRIGAFVNLDPSPGACSAMRCRTTVPQAMVSAEASANSTAIKLLCTFLTVVDSWVR